MSKSKASALAASPIGMDILFMLPELRGLWAMSNHNASSNIFDLTGQGLTLSSIIENPPTFGLDNFMGYAEGNGTDEITGRTDEAALDITGALSMFAYVYFDGTASAQESVMGKWFTTAGIQRSYILYRDASGNIVAGISTDGTATKTATSTSIVGATTWAYLGLSFTPSTSLEVYLGQLGGGADGQLESVTNVTAIPATIHSGTGGLIFFANQTGGVAASNFLDGRIAVAGLATSSWSDNIHNLLWKQLRQLLRV